uniref:Leucine-rich repeat-containing protein 34 n=2 Tax=Knipowitschia caucasica TaxID=637954 RepID=A0AAV2L201_KNICA
MLALAEVYHTFCAENQIKTNSHVSDVFGKTLPSENVVKLSGNNRLNPVQRLDDADAHALSKCLLNNKDVTALDLSYNNITDEGANHMSELLQRGKSLHFLDLTFNNIGEKGAQRFSQSLQSNEKLLSLTLSGNKVMNAGAMSLAHLLQVNNTLQVLRLAGCELDTQSVIAFAIALKSNSTLRCLDLSRPLLCGEQEEWAVHFAHMLAENQSLLELHLGTMGIMTSGMERLSKGLLFNYSLKYLDLRCNRVTRDDVRPLVDVLLRNGSTLEMLDLSSNQIKDQGAVCLSQALVSPNCSLKELSLCSNNIDSEGLLSLAEALTLNSTLTHLYIWGNRFQEPVCLAFRDLIENGRLHPDHTDVRAYEVDDHVFLAQVFQTLRRQFYEPKNNTDHISSEPERPADTTTAKGMRFHV